MANILHTYLVELDFSGIEAVLVGWFARDPQYVRIAKLGMHALVASHLVHRPVDMALPDAEIAAIFAALKKTNPEDYQRAKRVVHGTGYGMTPNGMVLMFPKDFPTLKAAQHVQAIYFKAAPAVPAWQNAIRARAHEQTYLGGPAKPGHTVLSDLNAHPYGYRHDFYGVLNYKPCTPGRAAILERQHVPLVILHGRPYEVVHGDDSKSAMAFYPQSTASGILKEVMLRLFTERDHSSYIGGAYYGRTPLRAPIHDSLLMEVPPRQHDRVLEAAYTEMLRPIPELPLPAAWNMGSHLVIGVEGKIGLDWDAMQKIPTPPGAAAAHHVPAVYSDVAGDKTYFPATPEEEEDVTDLMVQWRTDRAKTYV